MNERRMLNGYQNHHGSIHLFFHFNRNHWQDSHAHTNFRQFINSKSMSDLCECIHIDDDENAVPILQP